MHSLFGTSLGSNPGPFDPKSDTLTTTPPPLPIIAQMVYSQLVPCHVVPKANPNTNTRPRNS